MQYYQAMTIISYKWVYWNANYKVYMVLRNLGAKEQVENTCNTFFLKWLS
jgi:hypothetical protein